MNGWAIFIAPLRDFAAFATFARQKFKHPLPRSSNPNCLWLRRLGSLRTATMAHGQSLQTTALRPAFWRNGLREKAAIQFPSRFAALCRDAATSVADFS
jgi:hypothetical protein